MNIVYKTFCIHACALEEKRNLTDNLFFFFCFHWKRFEEHFMNLSRHAALIRQITSSFLIYLKAVCLQMCMLE